MERVLETIVEKSKKELEATRKRIPPALLESQIPELPPVRDFAAALRRPGRRIIAELKAASPSKGAIRPGLEREIETLASELDRAGAAALSILTEKNFFLGSETNLRKARRIVDIPLLRKDFIYDEYQILEARVWGADAILLIAAMLTQKEFRNLYAFATSLGLSVLCEAHTAEELNMLLEEGVAIVGINARNLSNFETSLALAGKLLQRIPRGTVAIAESAIHSTEDLNRMEQFGAKAFLIGESLMRAERPGEKLCEFLLK